MSFENTVSKLKKFFVVVAWYILAFSLFMAMFLGACVAEEALRTKFHLLAIVAFCIYTWLTIRVLHRDLRFTKLKNKFFSQSGKFQGYAVSVICACAVAVRFISDDLVNSSTQSIMLAVIGALAMGAYVVKIAKTPLK